MSADPKADPTLEIAMRAMLARGEAYLAECARRGVKFLPRQVMRPVYEKAGLPDGAYVKSRSNDFFVMRT